LAGFDLASTLGAKSLPSNTASIDFVKTDGTIVLDDTFWGVECKKVPEDALFVVVEMGSTRDYFKPLTVGTPVPTWCDMLRSHRHHRWSRDGISFVQPHYVTFRTSNGGSESKYLENVDKTPGDERQHVSFWGDETNVGGCCSTSYAQDTTGWGNAFTMAYGMQLQPPPPNTLLTELAIVAGTTVTNDVFWKKLCEDIPTTTAFLMLDMGATRDFFKPVQDETWCTMLVSHKKHQWSHNGLDWRTPGIDNFNNNGGSDNGWPTANVDGDSRRYLSFWGVNNDALTGGCCSYVYTREYNGWGKAFTVQYGVPLQSMHPPPPNTTVVEFVNVDGTANVDTAFWNKKCTEVPSDASFVMLTIGTTRDFFKPTKGKKFCEMLKSHERHQWSHDGINWRTPVYGVTTRFGGSQTDWPLENIDGDGRTFLSSWGTTGSFLLGGCCSSSYVGAAANNDGVGKAFTMAYGVPFQDLPPLPSDTTVTVFATVDGTICAHTKYWNIKCKEVPAEAKFVMLTMGATRDFFRPDNGATFCEMLISKSKHQWSSDGLLWATPNYDPNPSLLGHGGSQISWLQSYIDGDARMSVSWWGHNALKGGCCSTSYAASATFPMNDGSAWGQSFTMAYGLPVTSTMTTTTATATSVTPTITTTITTTTTTTATSSTITTTTNTATTIDAPTIRVANSTSRTTNINTTATAIDANPTATAAASLDIGKTSDEEEENSISTGAVAAIIVCILLALIGITVLVYIRTNKRTVIPPTAVNARGPAPAVQQNPAFAFGGGAVADGGQVDVYNAGGNGGVGLDSNNSLLYAIPMEAEDGIIDETGEGGSVFVAALRTTAPEYAAVTKRNRRNTKAGTNNPHDPAITGGEGAGAVENEQERLYSVVDVEVQPNPTRPAGEMPTVKLTKNPMYGGVGGACEVGGAGAGAGTGTGAGTGGGPREDGNNHDDMQVHRRGNGTPRPAPAVAAAPAHYDTNDVAAAGGGGPAKNNQYDTNDVAAAVAAAPGGSSYTYDVPGGEGGDSSNPTYAFYAGTEADPMYAGYDAPTEQQQTDIVYAEYAPPDGAENSEV
jgi:hypothetical protein